MDGYDIKTTKSYVLGYVYKRQKKHSYFTPSKLFTPFSILKTKDKKKTKKTFILYTI